MNHDSPNIFRKKQGSFSYLEGSRGNFNSKKLY